METTGNPIIWKKETCLIGECKGGRTEHWWSIPYTTPYGLTAECYLCRKTKKIIIESEKDVWINNEKSEFVRERLKYLNSLSFSNT